MSTLEEINQELAKFQLQYFEFKNRINAQLSEGFASQESFARLSELVAQVENRVKILEEVRQKQIEINIELLKMLNDWKEANRIINQPKKSFWDWLK